MANFEVDRFEIIDCPATGSPVEKTNLIKHQKHVTDLPEGPVFGIHYEGWFTREEAEQRIRELESERLR